MPNQTSPKGGDGKPGTNTSTWTNVYKDEVNNVYFRGHGVGGSGATGNWLRSYNLNTSGPAGGGGGFGGNGGKANSNGFMISSVYWCVGGAGGGGGGYGARGGNSCVYTQVGASTYVNAFIRCLCGGGGGYGGEGGDAENPSYSTGGGGGGYGPAGKGGSVYSNGVYTAAGIAAGGAAPLYRGGNGICIIRYKKLIYS